MTEVTAHRQRMFYRVALGLLGAVFLAVCIGLLAVLSQSWREYHGFKEREAKHSTRLAELQAEKAGREAYLRKLLEDPAFLDRVVRERLGYSREDEIIFKFEIE